MKKLELFARRLGMLGMKFSVKLDFATHLNALRKSLGKRFTLMD